MKIWSEDEEKQLIHEFKIKKKIKDIALTHERSETAIKLRIVHIINKMIENKDTFPKIYNTFNITKTEVDTLFRFAENYTENYKNSKIVDTNLKSFHKNKDISFKNNINEIKTNTSDIHYLNIYKKVEDVSNKIEKLEKILKSIYKKLK